MRLVPLLAMGAAVAGCTAGRDYARPSIDLPARFATSAPALGSPAAEWWRGFDDPMVGRLVDEALRSSPDVSAALARLDQARAGLRAASAGGGPEIGAAAAGTEQVQSLETPVGAVSRRLGLSRSYGLYEGGVQASWEPDLFGRIRRAREAAQADKAGAEADLAGVRLALAAETASAYIAIRVSEARLAAAQARRRDSWSLVGLVHQRAAQGLAAPREENRVRAEDADAEAALAEVRQTLAAQRFRLAILLGRPAGADLGLTGPPGAVPRAPATLLTITPADLLRARPDVVAAERRIAASSARTGLAIAEHYPHISLAGLLGLASLGTGRLLDGDAFQAGAGANLRWRLFDFGRVDAEVARSRGREAEALALWRGTVLRATGDVETALSRLAEAANGAEASRRRVTALAAARDQSRQAYAEGLVPLIDVLDADRSLLLAQEQLASLEGEQALAAVALQRASGGGWSAPAAATPAPFAQRGATGPGPGAGA